MCKYKSSLNTIVSSPSPDSVFAVMHEFACANHATITPHYTTTALVTMFGFCDPVAMETVMGDFSP